VTRLPGRRALSQTTRAENRQEVVALIRAAHAARTLRDALCEQTRKEMGEWADYRDSLRGARGRSRRRAVDPLSERCRASQASTGPGRLLLTVF